MGCAGSSQTKGDGTVKKIRKPKPWKNPQPLRKTQLMQMRDEFWDTAPHYGGQKGAPQGEMWQKCLEALKKKRNSKKAYASHCEGWLRDLGCTSSCFRS